MRILGLFLGFIVITLSLTGCMETTAVKYAVDKVCDSSPLEAQVLRKQIDTATAPHRVRVFCNDSD